MKSKQHLLRRSRMRWPIFLGVSITWTAVSTFGLLGVVFLGMNEDNAIAMVGMILPISIILSYALVVTLHSMEKKLYPLAEGLQKISDGDLDVVLDEKSAGEYEKLFRNFNVMAKELRATKEEMQKFVNEFAHEFKTPITSISGFADLLYESGDELSLDERREYLKIISEQSHRLTNLSQNTLLLSKVEACQIVTEREEFMLSDQINRCALLFYNECERKNITIELDEDFSFHYPQLNDS